jgi:5,10-methylenetetrahydromethanopterin reductase
MERLPELAFYGLAGHVDSPAQLLDEVPEAERIGLGSVFISERYNVKEAASLTGAAAAVTRELGVATGVTNHNTRHPIITASWATTMHRLSGGRFALGLGRGIAPLQTALGIPPPTMPEMEDFVGLCRRLWKGEMVLGHDGPAGSYPYLHLDSSFDEDIPVLMAALGPKTMAWAGGVMDGVILHTFIGDEALARCVARIRRGAERAGRDPARVRVWAVLLTMCDLPERTRLRYLVGRMATYMQVYGHLLVDLNGWDMAVLERFKQDPLVSSIAGAIDAKATDEQLEQIAELIPDEWLPAAVGSPDVCARRILDQLDAGADGVILHGSTPAELAPAVAAYRRVRPAARFAARSANPGR